MSKLVPEYISKLIPYSAGKPIEELAREKGLTQISKLASNENPLGPSPLAIEQIKLGLGNIHRYPDMFAFELKSLLAKMYKLKTSNIILGSGSESILSSICKTFLWPGEEVLTSENTFIGFYIIAQATGPKVTTVPLTTDYKFDLSAIAKKITNKTRVIYLANPNNPTGTFFTKKEFDNLMKFVPDHVLVILDEAYFEFASGQNNFPDSMSYRYDNVITLRTFSKAYGLAGIRLGYGFAHDSLISELTKVKVPFEPNSLAQLAGIGALKDTNHLNATLLNNKKQYERTFPYLEKNGLSPIPSVTNFITFKSNDPESLFENLLNEGVIIRTLKSNGMPNHLRVSMGSQEEMDHFFRAMDKIREKNGKF